MNETKHTPGPWARGKGGYADRIEAGSPPTAICEIWYGSLPRAEIGANAHLIAAAPTMETALRSILCNLALAEKEGHGLGMYAQLAIKAAESALTAATKEN